MIYILPDQKARQIKNCGNPFQSAHCCLQVIAERNCECGSRTAQHFVLSEGKSLLKWLVVYF